MPEDDVVKVKLVNEKTAWRVAVDIAKDISAVFALGAVLFALIPSSDAQVAIMSSMFPGWTEGREDAQVVTAGPSTTGETVSRATGWTYVGKAGQEDKWFYAVSGGELDNGAILEPTTLVNMRVDRVTALNPSPAVIDIVSSAANDCVRVSDVVISNTGSIWVFGGIVPCPE